MPRRKSTPPDPLFVAPAADEAVRAPADEAVHAPAESETVQVSYEVRGETWLVRRWDLLTAEFEGLRSCQLPDWHAAMESAPRHWLMVRRIFGVQPMIPPADFHEDDLRVWSRPELASAFGLDRRQLESELTVPAGIWEAYRRSLESRSTDTERPLPEKAKAPETELAFSTEDEVRKLGFVIKFQSREETDWFLGRVQDFRKVLEAPMAAGIARAALTSELQLRRLDGEINSSSPIGKEYRENVKLRETLAATYGKQMEQIEGLCPWAKAISGKYDFTGQMADVTRAILAYCERGDTALADGILTATEIAVELRRSAQMPVPRYRAGLIVYLNAARAGLWNPQWTSPFSSEELKRLDKAWAAAYVAQSEAEGVALPDLEAAGKDGEYNG